MEDDEGGGLIGAGEAPRGAAPLPSSTFSSSALGSYPSFSMRSASSLALFSAASKSIASALTFLAPSFVVFFAPSTLAFLAPPAVPVLRRAADDVIRPVVGFAESPVSCFERGDAERLMSLPLPAFRNGEGVRPVTGGVAVRETGGVGRLIAGLSQEEKKSSSGSPAGVPTSASAPSITTSSG